MIQRKTARPLGRSPFGITHSAEVSTAGEFLIQRKGRLPGRAHEKGARYGHAPSGFVDHHAALRIHATAAFREDRTP